MFLKFYNGCFNGCCRVGIYSKITVYAKHQTHAPGCILFHHFKPLGKLGNIVAETFVIRDVSSNVSFAYPWKRCCGNKSCFPGRKNVSCQIQKPSVIFVVVWLFLCLLTLGSMAKHWQETMFPSLARAILFIRQDDIIHQAKRVT